MRLVLSGRFMNSPEPENHQPDRIRATKMNTLCATSELSILPLWNDPQKATLFVLDRLSLSKACQFKARLTHG